MTTSFGLPVWGVKLAPHVGAFDAAFALLVERGACRAHAPLQLMSCEPLERIYEQLRIDESLAHRRAHLPCASACMRARAFARACVRNRGHVRVVAPLPAACAP